MVSKYWHLVYVPANTLWHQIGARKGLSYLDVKSLVSPILALKGKGRFVNRPTTTGGKKYDKFFLYLPTELVKDSQFPFKEGDLLEIEIDTKKRRLFVVMSKSTQS